MAQTSFTIPTTDRTQVTPTLYNNLVNDITDLYNRATGWIEITDDAWAYASATTITADDIRFYPIGTKIRYKQGGAYKYGVVTLGSSTLLTIGKSGDYTLANAAITDIAVSFSISPAGWPGAFNWTATNVVGWSTAPTVLVKYLVEGNLAVISAACGIETSNSGVITFDSPFAGKVYQVAPGPAQVMNNGTIATTPGLLTATLSGGVTIVNLAVLRDWASTGFTTSGNKLFDNASLKMLLKD